MKLSLFITFICIPLLLPFASGDVVFSTLGPGDSFRNQAGLAVTGPDVASSPGFEVDAGASFTPITTTNLDYIDVAVTNFGGSNVVHVRISQDNGGLPNSTVLQEATVTIPSINSPALLRAEFDNTLTLQAGVTYWVWLSSPDDGSNTWMPNDQTIRTGYIQAYNPGIDGGGTWNYVTSTAATPAFRVVGTNTTLGPVEISMVPKLTFATVVGKTYSIQASDVPSGPYTEIGSKTGDGTTQSFIDERDLTLRQFYRIAVSE